MFENTCILTIDDSDTIRTYLQKVLAARGAVVEGAPSGREGLDMCAAKTYDLILLDLLLPDLDGIEILKRIRANNDKSTVVMLTGHGGIKSAIAAVQMGADGYLEKQDITSTVHNHAEFIYALERAMEHRAGIVTQKQLEAIRSDFYAMVTHDLRNPTAIILMATNMLINERGKFSGPKEQELMMMIEDAGVRLMRLINDYLDFAKIDAGYLRLDVEHIDLRQVVESSVQLSKLQTQARQQELNLEIPSEPLLAHADAERLKQVLDNLLSNAIKYTPAGGSITLRLQDKGQFAEFSVSDTGKGISAAYIPLLFTKYHRLPDKANQKIPGTGLGLLIAKEIVEAHGGTIEAESTGIPGEGTTFTFTIPYLVSTPAQPPAQAAPPRDLPFFDEDELHAVFIEESQQHVALLKDVLGQLAGHEQDERLLETAQRTAHTLKGNASAMRVTLVRDLATEVDEVLRQARKGITPLTPAIITNLLQAVDQIEVALTTA